MPPTITRCETPVYCKLYYTYLQPVSYRWDDKQRSAKLIFLYFNSLIIIDHLPQVHLHQHVHRHMCIIDTIWSPTILHHLLCLCYPSRAQDVQWSPETWRQPQHQRGQLWPGGEPAGVTPGGAGARTGPAQEEGDQDLQQDRCQTVHQCQEVGPGPLGPIGASCDQGLGELFQGTGSLILGRTPHSICGGNLWRTHCWHAQALDELVKLWIKTSFITRTEKHTYTSVINWEMWVTTELCNRFNEVWPRPDSLYSFVYLVIVDRERCCRRLPLLVTLIVLSLSPLSGAESDLVRVHSFFLYELKNWIK